MRYFLNYLLICYFHFVFSNPNKMSIVSGKFVYYYMARESLCFLTICEESYSKRSAFMYLEDIADLILQELVKEYGNDVSTIIGDRNMPSLVVFF